MLLLLRENLRLSSLIDNTLLKGYNEICNPHISNDIMYFECAKLESVRPTEWEIWSYNLIDNKLKFITNGANPSIYNNKLIYSCGINYKKLSRFELKVLPLY